MNLYTPTAFESFPIYPQPIPRWKPSTVLVNKRGEVLWHDWLGHQCADADARLLHPELRSQAAQLRIEVRS
jgi:hypothetical protein